VVRVVSLVPSVTETLLAWGVEPVACTRFCEQPAIRAVGGTKNPDVPAIVDLAPDLVVMCDEENRREDAEVLEAAGLAVHSCSPRSVADVEPALVELAARLAVDRPVADRLPVPSPLGLRAFVPIWRRPWMSLAAATYGSSVLEAIGVTNVFADHPDRYPEVTLEEAVAGRPDVVLLPSEPYPFQERHHGELARVATVVPVDGQDLFWWGERTRGALVRLRDAIEASTRPEAEPTP
jgi:ABC-type Fe3+-hydroxamate transport system substrate-binding protein